MNRGLIVKEAFLLKLQKTFFYKLNPLKMVCPVTKEAELCPLFHDPPPSPEDL